MAAHATGHRQTDHINIVALAEAGYDFARTILKPGGTYLAKVLRGGTEGQLLNLMKKDFASVRHVKPLSSRDGSAELFVLAMGFRGWVLNYLPYFTSDFLVKAATASSTL